MKALTLHQPWASLVALGVKTIETRSWSTTYRGPLAIHAGAKRFGFNSPTAERIRTFPLQVWRQVPSRWADAEMDGNYPLGAIVATCTLVDVVPIVHGACGPGHAVLQAHADCLLGDDPYGDPRIQRNFTDQRPYGDFTPGRFAWLLADVEPVEPPVPFKGGQRLTKTWTP